MQTVIQKIRDKKKYLDNTFYEIENKFFSDPHKQFIYLEPSRVQDNFQELFFRMGKNYKVTAAWIHVLSPGYGYDPHQHEMDTGVYYLKAPKNSGNLVLDDLNVEITPEEDMFVIVPGGTHHSIKTNNSKELRIALAMKLSNIK